MAKYTINKKQLKESIQAVVSEAIDAYGMSGDYMNDMQNLADTTGEEMDDAFLDSVAQYDGRDGDGGPVYPDRKNSEMNADWFNDDYEAKDSQAKYGYNADELDRLNAFTDTADQYLNDINYNQYDNSGADVLGSEWDKAEAEREYPMEAMIRNAVKQSISEVIKGSYDNPQHPDDFSQSFGTAAHKFAHDGVDAYWARKDQDKMEKKEKKSMKRNTKRSMNAADKRQLHRKGSLNRAFDESKQKVTESTGRYLYHAYVPGEGNFHGFINDLNEIKPIIKKAEYWDVTKGWNATDPNNLIAWGGKGGFWDYFLNKPDWAKEGVHWSKPKERERQLVLSKKKELQPMAKLECKIRNVVKETLDEIEDDDAAFWKQQQDDEMSYDMREFTKAMQKANGTYHAKSSDGQFQTGDRVIVHGRTQNIEGIITDFGTNLMTWKENCDVDYEKDGKTYTLMSVPLNKIEKISTNESKKT